MDYLNFGIFQILAVWTALIIRHLLNIMGNQLLIFFNETQSSYSIGTKQTQCLQKTALKYIGMEI